MSFCEVLVRLKMVDAASPSYLFKLILGEAFPLACPNCGGDIRLMSFITQPETIRKILTHLGEPLVPPPVSPARGPPVDWDDLVQAENDHSLYQATPDDLPMIDIHRR